MTERRNEERHAVPKIYRKYVTFKARADSGEFVPMKLLDFSDHGIRMKSPHGLSVDSRIECVIAAPKSFSKEILFVGKIKYCIQDASGGGFVIGEKSLKRTIRSDLNYSRKFMILSRKESERSFKDERG